MKKLTLILVCAVLPVQPLATLVLVGGEVRSEVTRIVVLCCALAWLALAATCYVVGIRNLMKKQSGPGVQPHGDENA